MKKIDFSEIITLVGKGERTHTRFQWELGDALIRAIGRPSPSGAQDGSFAKLEACSEELKQHGYEYEALTLKNLRFNAWRFPPESRDSGIGWHAHYLAGTPEMLDIVIEGAPRNQKITAAYVLSVTRGMALARQQELAAETEQRRVAYEKAKREREAAEAEAKTAKTAAEREAAADRAKAAMKKQKASKSSPKKREAPTTKPKPEDVPLLVARAAFAADLSQIRRSVTKLRETYEPLLAGFTDADTEHGHEVLMTVAEMARSFADVLRKGNGGKASHLSVVDNAG